MGYRSDSIAASRDREPLRLPPYNVAGKPGAIPAIPNASFKVFRLTSRKRTFTTGSKQGQKLIVEVRKILLVSVKFVSAILGPEMGAPILWTPGKNAFFLQEKPCP